MYYEVAKVQRLKDSTVNDYYLLVHCWLNQIDAIQGKPPYLTEEFHIQRAAQSREIITDVRGFLRTAAGHWVDPSAIPDPEPEWAYKTVTVNLRAEFAGVIERTLKGQIDAGFQGDHTGDSTKSLYRYGRLAPQASTARPLEGDGVELYAITPLAREVA